MQSLVLLLLILAAFWFWHSALRAREAARALARDLCRRAGVQLLDQTVALQRLRCMRVAGRGLGVRRDYRFEFSCDGSDRHQAMLSMFDDRVLMHSLAAADGAAVVGVMPVLPAPPAH